MHVVNPSNANQLRRKKRESRRALSVWEQNSHALQLFDQVIHHPRYFSSNRIACYLANDGEIDPGYIIRQAWSQRKRVYLPVLSPLKNSLHFAPFKPDSPMQCNQYGIMEPACHPDKWIAARHIDLILVPLVAFDETGHRLGMGGGFYDRSLEHLKLRQHIRKPYLIGLAHELQKTEKLSVASWDIPLDAIATEKQIYRT